MEVRCTRADVEVGVRELWRRAVGVREARSSEALEVRCRRRAVEVFVSRALELWRRAVGVATWRCGALETYCRCSDEEVTRYGGGLQACRHGGIEVWSSGALEVRCRRVDVYV